MYCDVVCDVVCSSSQAFIDEHFVDSEQALCRFRLALMKGVLVRRHQAGKLAGNLPIPC